MDIRGNLTMTIQQSSHTRENINEHGHTASMDADSEKRHYIFEWLSHACTHELIEPTRNTSNFIQLISYRNATHFDDESLHDIQLIRQTLTECTY